jgi:two-component system nitrogen regulation sensor histidine kinase NtrY
MTFRTRLLLFSSCTLAGAVALVTGAVSVAARRAFERTDETRRVALLHQFERELKVRSAEIAIQVEQVSQSDEVARMAVEANGEPDFAAFYKTAQILAERHGLDFLDITRRDQTILSSAHWPARFGYKDDWAPASASTPVHVPMPDGTVSTALASAREQGDLLVLGARRLDSAFMKTLGEAPGMRAVLWLSPKEAFDAQGVIADPGSLLPAIGARHSVRIGDEAFVSKPLASEQIASGVLLAASSLDEQLSLERKILWIGFAVGGSGILLGVLLGIWTTERITRPMELLATGARAVAAGDWSATVPVASNDEIGELARTFNRMTAQLVEQRNRALQAERVAAWRELARRLAHELKNPLFPLQITVENLERARASSAEEFDEVFRESTSTLLGEIGNLKTIIGRFSDFAKMPAPRFEQVDVNEIARSVMKFYQPRSNAAQLVSVELDVPAEPLLIEADPDQLRRALGNLALNAIDAMKEGGTLRAATSVHNGFARIEVSDTGQGLTEEERARLFTPYYTTKQYGTGLGLAIVQSVVSDHHGRIAVESEPGRGATFVVELPVRQDGKA